MHITFECYEMILHIFFLMNSKKISNIRVADPASALADPVIY